MVNSLMQRLLLTFTLLITCGAQGATWTATGATLGNTISFVSGGATFTDKVYNGPNEWVWIDRYDGGAPRYSMNFSFDLGGSQAPKIDIAGMRGDFSSLLLTAYNPDGTAVIGRDIGLMGWVPIISNPDGSYTASWVVGPPYIFWNSFIGLPLSLSFTSAIDEPSPVQLLVLALPVLLAVVKRRASKRCQPVH